MSATAIDLMRFAGKGDPREYMRLPIPCPGGAFATNGHVMTFLEGAQAEPVANLPEKVRAVAEDYRHKARTWGGPWVPALSIPLVGDRQCYRCDGSGRITSEVCEECEGDGTFAHGTHEYDCKECDGEGVFEESVTNGGEDCPDCGGSKIHPEPVEIAGITPGLGLSTRYLYLLRDLPACEVSWAESVIAFRFAGGCGVVMPIKGNPSSRRVGQQKAVMS